MQERRPRREVNLKKPNARTQSREDRKARSLIDTADGNTL